MVLKHIGRSASRRGRFMEAGKTIEILKHMYKGSPSTEQIEALEEACSALEKQIPKKMLERHYEEPGETPIIKYTCPCGCRIQPMQSSNYCRICGQALDWSGLS